MNLEGRKDNTYYDQTGKQILVGDLLKVYHFGKGNRTQYMYHVAVMEETQDFPVMALRCYTKDKPHYRLYVVCDNEQRVYRTAKIINMHDWESKRKRIKVSTGALAFKN
jgi:hypothetical protein